MHLKWKKTSPTAIKILRNLRMNEAKHSIKALKRKCICLTKRQLMKWTDIKFMNRKIPNDKALILFPRKRAHICENLSRDRDGTIV